MTIFSSLISQWEIPKESKYSMTPTTWLNTYFASLSSKRLCFDCSIHSNRSWDALRTKVGRVEVLGFAGWGISDCPSIAKGSSVRLRLKTLCWHSPFAGVLAGVYAGNCANFSGVVIHGRAFSSVVLSETCLEGWWVWFFILFFACQGVPCSSWTYLTVR